MIPETDVAAESSRCVRRAALERRPLHQVDWENDNGADLWFVKITLGGRTLDPEAVHGALEQLSVERAFLVSAGYGHDRAEVRYWEEASEMGVATQQAVSLWGGPEIADALPDWRIVGLEVVDRETARRRWETGERPPVHVLGEIVPLDA